MENLFITMNNKSCLCPYQELYNRNPELSHFTEGTDTRRPKFNVALISGRHPHVRCDY